MGKSKYIDEFLKESKLRDVDKQIGKILSSLELIDTSVNKITDFIDSKRVSKILSRLSKIENRLDDLEDFESNLKDAL